MTKISKSIFLSIVICITLVLTGCLKNSYVTEKNGVDITISKSLREYMLYKDEIPKLHFDYDNVNVMYDAEGAACFFVSNDQYELSDKFAEHLKRYSEDQIIIISETAQKYDDGKARIGKDQLKLDEVDEFGNEQKYSKEYQLVCTDSNGVRYSYQYRTFVSGGKRYYGYRYSSNIGISLEQSLMVVKDENNKNKLLLLPLPFDTKYELSGSVAKFDSLINKDTYLNEKYYRFAYPDALTDYEESEKIELLKDWYEKYCNGHENEIGDFIIEFLGATYKVTFGLNNCSNTQDKPGFKLEFIG